MSAPMTVTLPPETAAAIQQALDGGEYTSSSEVIQEAVREWSLRRQAPLADRIALQADIDQGLADVAAGRVKPFSEETITARGRQLLAARSS